MKFPEASAIVNAHLQSILAVELALVFDVVHHGGTFTVQGQPGATPRYTTRLSSPHGGRGVSSNGEDLEQCLRTLLVMWGKQ